MTRNIFVAASMALLPALVAATQTIDPRVMKARLDRFTTAITLDVKQFGGDFTTWTRDWSEADPQGSRSAGRPS